MRTTSRSRGARGALIAALAAVSLAACSGAEEGTDPAASSASSSSVAPAPIAPVSPAEGSARPAEPPAGQTAPEGQPAPAEQAASAEQAAPEGQPAPEGRPAPETAAPAAEITNLLKGQYEQTTLRGMVTYAATNSCQATQQSNGLDPAALEQVADVPLAQTPGYDASAKLVAVNNVQVDGDRASADVTAVSHGAEQTVRMVFAREGGQWKFCE